MRTRPRNRATLFRLAASAALAAGALAAPQKARAQSDVNPPLPNAMLLVDTSGSMEYMMGVDPATKKVRLPLCNEGNTSQPNEQNRWVTLITVLAGEIPEYSCWHQSRSDPDFITEFTVNGVKPYDKDYYLPFTRVISWNGNGAGCTMGPDMTNWPGAGGIFSFSPNAIKAHRLKDLSQDCPPAYGAGGSIPQTQDGLLDAFRDKVRFGLMTFDSATSPKTGLGAGYSVDMTGGSEGLWSYYPGWDSNASTYAKGRPEQCGFDQTIEVGARNPAAPPWEGRLIAFGPPAAPATDISATNEKIQQSLMTIRPYGATPLAGMLADAQYFFQADPSLDYTDINNASKRFGPKDDPYVTGGCRKQFIILLTDGAPNLDLRPGCKNNAPGPPDGTCPFKTPEQIAYDLAHPPDPNRAVTTFVVGFALSQADSGTPTPIDCTKLVNQQSGSIDPVCANPPNDSVRACCQMATIAYNGGSGHAYFADDKLSLRMALNDILSQVAKSTTTRTLPVFAPASSGGGGGAAGYNFFSSFLVSTGSLWSGVLERQRMTCNQDQATKVFTIKEEDVDKTKGDSFSDNMTSGVGSPRYFYTVEPNGNVSARTTIRVSPPSADGLGTTGAVLKSGDINSFYSLPDPNVMELPVAGSQKSVCGTAKTPVLPADCRNRIMRWETGLPPIDGSSYTREKHPLGSIYHSTPVVVGPPREYIRDEAYSVFMAQQAKRPQVLFTSTTDGQLHAFQIDVDPKLGKVNNELWSFLPPGVLPGMKSVYPGVEQRLLDQPVVVRDVIYARSRLDAQSPYAVNAPAYKTVLVSGFGPSLGGYFALDVTKPVRDVADPTSGPRFLWQVATDDTQATPLFGSGVTPMITTLFFQAPGEAQPKEIAVAILPGGDGAESPPGGACTRVDTNPTGVDAKWKARTAVKCYSDVDPSRSVTIVRLDTGEVIRRFHRCGATGYPFSSALSARSTCAPFDSPVTGTPVVYPNGTGLVATRAFVGDRDGTMWRLDLSSTDPAKWKVGMFFDAFDQSDPAGPLGGQPIAQPPAMAVDNVGNLVMIFSTGDQDQFVSTPNMRNVAWSVSEVPDPLTGAVKSRANWHLGRGETIPDKPAAANTNWQGGERVAGPIAIFNSVAYFATFRPSVGGADVCSGGSGFVWGVDYLRSTTAGVSDAGPIGRLPSASPNVFPPAYVPQTAGFVTVGIGRQPTCYDTTTYNDPYLAYGGGVTSVGNLTAGDYQLLIQTGNKGTSIPGGSTNVSKLTLPRPPPSVRLSSWAAVVE